VPEFTSSKDKAVHAGNPDDALVFYPKTRADYQAILDKLATYRIKTLKAKNPTGINMG